jgi:ribosomal protein S26
MELFGLTTEVPVLTIELLFCVECAIFLKNQQHFNGVRKMPQGILS